MDTAWPKPFQPIKMLQIIGGVFFAYLFFGFMLLPCLNTLTSIFTVKNAAGETDPLAVIRFFLAGSTCPSMCGTRSSWHCALSSRSTSSAFPSCC